VNRRQQPGKVEHPTPRQRSAKRGRLFAAVLSAAFHLLILLALFSVQAQPPKALSSAPMTVALVDAPRLAPAAKPLAKAQPAAAKRSAAKPAAAKPVATKPVVRRSIFRPTPARPEVDLPAANQAVAEEGASELSDAELAGAATAGSGQGGSGGGGRACDMVRLLQDALRKDALVQAAVAPANRTPGAAGKAIMVWNGDWVATLGQDGKGLAAVREAIMWEVAFAPAACRNEPVRGLVLISLADAPGTPRLVVGSREWRWADLLTPRSSVPDTMSRR